jgi:hypothetical protein
MGSFHRRADDPSAIIWVAAEVQGKDSEYSVQDMRHRMKLVSSKSYHHLNPRYGASVSVVDIYCYPDLLVPSETYEGWVSALPSTSTKAHEGNCDPERSAAARWKFI